ncbi:ABC transporter substrate-binding protein [Sedimenticola selenatireducens]|uniref:ABC transporter substrate-binding protein n=1 Tax=Sedimenticola selenatireducens TaxID=191960 RepID=A0A557SK77_9GAMM|nr:ABC transporter substrate binding protein [Sedimenticola selenatireducens]TVO77783.1 hypothetical protein FHP88_03005 [Sedimenticola selenatireducens]TVT65088.1 MAG: hypothetical protein FHK78_05370 [Sedimenticola selenatireducens]
MSRTVKSWARHGLSLLLLITLLGPTLTLAADRCLYISSYHQGYAWSDGVERGIRNTLGERCELRQLDMDTKRNKGDAYIQQIVEKTKHLIEEWQPNVIITSDDNAAKYLIQAHYKNAKIPFVFCGVNWTISEYGFPYSNVTGIIEVAPLKPMLEQAARLSSHSLYSAYYIGADTLTEKKNFSRIQAAAAELGITLEKRLVSNMADWKKAYLDAQNQRYIVLGSHSGISDWNAKEMAQFTADRGQIVSVTNHDWMMPFTLLGFTKIPEEHGEWAAKAAIAILDGTSPIDIPIVSNRKWDLWLNPILLEKSAIKLPRKLTRKAKKVTTQP